MERSGWPDESDFVVCSVQKVADFGAFVSLDEYGAKEGLIHISEVASGWVKYIRDHVREGQKIVCKVLFVDADKQHIDLSLKDVNEHQRREKIQEWKNEQKAEKWIQYVAESTKTDKEGLEGLTDLFYNELGSVYSAFEKAMLSGESALTKIGVSDDVAKMITQVANDNLKKPQVDISGYVDLICPNPEGIEVIRKALVKADEMEGDEIKVDVSYVGAPRYRIRVIAPDYKKAESILKKSSDAAIKIVQKAGGTGEFFRHKESKT